ncbi:hypothetical protein SEA_RASPUTIA_26 [Microbacterium phage Rasputia]|nr:hypothetical protein SEA_RASPUTIA_26 [Microbacterium phage Rasputia]
MTEVGSAHEHTAEQPLERDAAVSAPVGAGRGAARVQEVQPRDGDASLHVRESEAEPEDGVELRRCAGYLNGVHGTKKCIRKVWGPEGARCWQHKDTGDRTHRKVSLSVIRGDSRIQVESVKTVAGNLSAQDLQWLVDHIASGTIMSFLKGTDR